MSRNWEKCYQDGETPWDRGGEAPPLLEILARLGTAPWGGGPVLVPGCGIGHDVRALAAAGLAVVGLDVAPTAVAMARQYPAAGSEGYECGDFLKPSWLAGRGFSAIWEHTCFCAIDPAQRPAYARAAAAVLAPGRHLFGVFYLRPHRPGEPDDGPPFGVTVEGLDAVFGHWFERLDGWVPRRAYPGRKGREWLAVYRRNARPC
ncbi:MAG: TPMT family class I SAM-dependent methyltransferase [Akkermansiaceae bacterium]|jgi:SAM-dependent methyltransferase|nr:TPMT family class I SAM-dependent methyltransferase [Akkermansiaceae bacterium]